MTDPRNSARPAGDAGSNWARCSHCGRGAHHLRDIRHAKECLRRQPIDVHTRINQRAEAAFRGAFDID